MFRSLAVVLGASLFLTACGGGGGGKSSSSETSSSVAAVSSVASVVSSSSIAISSSSVVSSSSSSLSSSSAGPAVIDLPIASWYAEKQAAFAAGVVAVTAQWQGAGYYLVAPVPELEFATIEVTVAVDNAFKTSGSGLSLWAVVDVDPWLGKNDCAAVESSALVEGADTKVTCVLNTGGTFAQTATAVKLGIQATGAAPAGTFTIKSARIVQTTEEDFPKSSSSAASVSSESSVSSSFASSEASSSVSSVASSSSSVSSSAPNVVLTLPATTPQWWGDNGATVTQVGSHLEVGYFGEFDAATYWVAPADAAIEGRTIEINVDVSSGFKTSDGALQVYAFVDGGAYPEESDCGWLMAAVMVPGTTQTVSCLIDTVNNDFAQTNSAVKIQLRARGTAPSGTVNILGGRVVAP